MTVALLNLLTSTSWKTWARISQPSCSKIIDTQTLYDMINGCCPSAANFGIIHYIAIGNIQILVTGNRMMLSNTLKIHEWLWKNISVFQFCFQFRCSYSTCFSLNGLIYLHRFNSSLYMDDSNTCVSRIDIFFPSFVFIWPTSYLIFLS